MEILSFPATQEYLVSKYDHFNAASLLLLKTFAPATYSEEFGLNGAHWKSPLPRPCRFTPSLYNVTWQALHDEALMIYFLSWNMGIVPSASNSVRSH